MCIVVMNWLSCRKYTEPKPTPHYRSYVLTEHWPSYMCLNIYTYVSRKSIVIRHSNLSKSVRINKKAVQVPHRM